MPTSRAAADYQPVIAASGGTYDCFTSASALASFVSKRVTCPPADPLIIRNVQREVKTPILLIDSDFDT